jgi:hypothetical protein
MTGLMTTVGTLLAASALALGGPLDPGDDRELTRTALVIDASHARDGRELVDPRLREADAEVRLPRTSAEARTNVRYFDALGYRIVVAGPRARAAADAVGVAAERTPNLTSALQTAAR